MGDCGMDVEDTWTANKTANVFIRTTAGGTNLPVSFLTLKQFPKYSLY